MDNEKRMIDINSDFVLKDTNGHTLDFGYGFIQIYDGDGNLRCQFDIDDIPTVDAVEVAHGKWIEDYETFVQDNGYESEPIHTGFVCSMCGRRSCSIEPYCHCGAKMDDD